MELLDLADMKALGRMLNTREGEALCEWVRSSRENAIQSLLAANTEIGLATARGYVTALDDIVKTLDTLPDVIRGLGAQQENRATGDGSWA